MGTFKRPGPGMITEASQEPDGVNNAATHPLVQTGKLRPACSSHRQETERQSQQTHLPDSEAQGSDPTGCPVSGGITGSPSVAAPPRPAHASPWAPICLRPVPLAPARPGPLQDADRPAPTPQPSVSAQPPATRTRPLLGCGDSAWEAAIPTVQTIQTRTSCHQS